MALLKRFFYRNPPDGLLEISERTYVFDCCLSTDVLDEEEYRIYVGRIVSKLQEYNPDASFLVFNFRDGTERSRIAEVLSPYDMTIMEYPGQYEGCPLLPFEIINHFLRSSECWLTLSQKNVLLMHCERGGWPLLAFMLAGLLIYRKQYSSEQRTLAMMYKQAPIQLLHLLYPLNPMPSQLRYLTYISRRGVSSDWPPSDIPLFLDCIIFRVLPPVGVGGRGFRPVVRVCGQDPSSTPNRSSKLFFSSLSREKHSRHYQQEEYALVKIDIHQQVHGDIVLECFHLDDDFTREEMMFRIMFHTAFIRSHLLKLNRDEVDVMWDAKDMFSLDFTAEVLFSGADAVPSIITTDVASGDKTVTGSASLDVLSRVQEIFCQAPKAPDFLNS